MKKIIVLLGVIACSYSSMWSFGNHGVGGLTLGEISLGHQDLRLFNIGTDSHSLSFLGDHSPSLDKISNWRSDINNFHGGIIPIVNHIGIPMIAKMPINIPHPVVQTIPQPYPVAVVIPKAVPYEVQKQVIKTVEKKVPTPVERIIPIKIEKPVPFHVVKHVPIPIEKPIPIKIPIYKTIVHKVKGH